jgi:hypothetical protein
MRAVLIPRAVKLVSEGECIAGAEILLCRGLADMCSKGRLVGLTLIEAGNAQNSGGRDPGSGEG